MKSPIETKLETIRQELTQGHFEDVLAKRLARVEADVEETVRTLSFNVEMLGRSFDALAFAQEVEPPTEQEFPEKGKITADMISDDEPGFYDLQKDSVGRFARWTGPQEDFHFEVAIDRSEPRMLRLSRASAVDPGIVLSTRLFVDSREVPVRKVGDVLEAVIPALKRTERTTHLAFLLERTVRPADIPNAGSDKRQLGLYFRSLELG